MPTFEQDPQLYKPYNDGTNGPPDERRFSGEHLMNSQADKLIDRLDADMRELRADVKGWKLWVVGTGVSIFIGLAAIIISLLTYHATVMQSQLTGIQSQMSQYQSQLNAQMQTFSEYVKAVTHPQETQVPKTPQKHR